MTIVCHTSARIFCTFFGNSILVMSEMLGTNYDYKSWFARYQLDCWRVKLVGFNVCITGCYFHTCFILVANCDIKHVSRSNHSDVSPKVLSKGTHKHFKNCKSWFKIQAKVLKNMCKRFFACSVFRTTSIIWDAFSSSNKLFSLRWAHHH